MGAQNRVGWWDFGFVGLATLVLLGLVASRELFLFSRALRLLLGFAYVLYVPGYCLTAALFPKAGELDGIERAGIDGCMHEIRTSKWRTGRRYHHIGSWRR